MRILKLISQKLLSWSKTKFLLLIILQENVSQLEGRISCEILGVKRLRQQ